MICKSVILKNATKSLCYCIRSYHHRHHFRSLTSCQNAPWT